MKKQLLIIALALTSVHIQASNPTINQCKTWINKPTSSPKNNAWIKQCLLTLTREINSLSNQLSTANNKKQADALFSQYMNMLQARSSLATLMRQNGIQ